MHLTDHSVFPVLNLWNGLQSLKPSGNPVSLMDSFTTFIYCSHYPHLNAAAYKCQLSSVRMLLERLLSLTVTVLIPSLLSNLCSSSTSSVSLTPIFLFKNATLFPLALLILITLLQCFLLKSKHHLQYYVAHLFCLLSSSSVSSHPPAISTKAGIFFISWRVPNFRTVPGTQQALNNYLLNEWRTVWSVIIYHSSYILECQKDDSSPSCALDIPRLELQQPFLQLDFSYTEPNMQRHSSSIILSKTAHISDSRFFFSNWHREWCNETRLAFGIMRT